MVSNNQLQQAAKALYEGHLEEADRLFRRILRGAPELFDALHALGIIAFQRGHPQRALGFYDRALRQNPNISQLHNNRANALNALNRPAEALASLDAALALAPNDPILHLGRGSTLTTLHRHAEALNHFAQAAVLDPTLLAARQNKAAAEIRLGLYETALATSDQLIALQPAPGAQAPLAGEFVRAHWNAAAICLTLGDYARGWREYEWRWHPPFDGKRHDFAQPLWRGEALHGQTILLHAEQGFGDTIQFCRYAPLVKARGARILLEAPAPLLPLLQTLSGVDELLPEGAPPLAFDVHCPLMSLPLACGTELHTIPAAAPYLAADPARLAKWDDILGPRTRLRIGLAWSGSEQFNSDASRSAPLASLAPLVRPGIEIVAVQKDVRPADAEAAQKLGVRIVSEALADFADTAALITLLDLTVSVDTAAAHLAGALGRPVWLLLHHAAEWRWLRHRDDSPWYPSARLFRQKAPLEWTELADRVAEALDSVIHPFFEGDT